MLAKKITFEGIEGYITEEFMFHISQAQILELNLPYADEADSDDPDEVTGLAKYLQDIVASDDNLQIYAQFKKIVLMAVGKKSEDGKRFLKSEEIRQDFENTEAYGELIIELMEDAEAAAKFFTGIMPAKVQEQNKQAIIDAANAAGAKSVEAPQGMAVAKARVVTQAELDAMDPKEALDGMVSGKLVLGGD